MIILDSLNLWKFPFLCLNNINSKEEAKELLLADPATESGCKSTSPI